jgi:ankyrin repeat protein
MHKLMEDGGYTPLHCAVFSDLPECCELLLRAGAVASLSLLNISGKTPLDIASGRQNRCQAVLQRYASNG